MNVALCNKRANTWHVPEFGGGATCDVAPNIFLPAYRIMEDIGRSEPESMSWYVLNLGANNGIDGDPFFNALVRNPTKWRGLAIEPSNAILSSKTVFEWLQRNYKRFPGISLLHGGITASDAARVSKSKNPNPGKNQSIDYLKLDIDSCDCHVLRTLMEDPYYHAKVLQVELNHHLPPPIMYNDMCKNDVHGLASPGNVEVCVHGLEPLHHGYVEPHHSPLSGHAATRLTRASSVLPRLSIAYLVAPTHLAMHSPHADSTPRAVLACDRITSRLLSTHAIHH